VFLLDVVQLTPVGYLLFRRPAAEPNLSVRKRNARKYVRSVEFTFNFFVLRLASPPPPNNRIFSVGKTVNNAANGYTDEIPSEDREQKTLRQHSVRDNWPTLGGNVINLSRSHRSRPTVARPFQIRRSYHPATRTAQSRRRGRLTTARGSDGPVTAACRRRMIGGPKRSTQPIVDYGRNHPERRYPSVASCS